MVRGSEGVIHAIPEEEYSGQREQPGESAGAGECRLVRLRAKAREEGVGVERDRDWQAPGQRMEASSEHRRDVIRLLCVRDAPTAG